MENTIVVLGGYGNFGRRIVDALSQEPASSVLIAGRDLASAEALATSIGGNTHPCQLDHCEDGFSDHLRALHASVLIHTAGPFQRQDYAVAKACVTAKCHYLDIADGREYVAGIGTLNAQAQSNDVLVVTGASSLPALSSAIVDRFIDQFARLDSIEFAITSGAKPPGIATMRGVLSYAGRPFRRLSAGEWRTVYGWQKLRALDFSGAVGSRWVAACDVPDLDLFPRRYPTIHTAIFDAGVGFKTTTLGVWLLSWLVRLRISQSVANYSQFLHTAATRLEPFGSKWSAMRVHLSGIGRDNRIKRKTWILRAGNDDGPNIPCFPAIVLARKLVRGQISARGAMPCMGLLSAGEILGAVPGMQFEIEEFD